MTFPKKSHRLTVHFQARANTYLPRLRLSCHKIKRGGKRTCFAVGMERLTYTLPPPTSPVDFLTRHAHSTLPLGGRSFTVHHGWLVVSTDTPLAHVCRGKGICQQIDSKLDLPHQDLICRRLDHHSAVGKVRATQKDSAIRKVECTSDSTSV